MRRRIVFMLSCVQCALLSDKRDERNREHARKRRDGAAAARHVRICCVCCISCALVCVTHYRSMRRAAHALSSSIAYYQQHTVTSVRSTTLPSSSWGGGGARTLLFIRRYRSFGPFCATKIGLRVHQRQVLLHLCGARVEHRRAPHKLYTAKMFN